MTTSPETGVAEKRELVRQRLEKLTSQLPNEAHEPFPLTDIQTAYYVGRSPDLPLGGVATHAYVELESHTRLDVPRLEQALRRLVDEHEMLRAVVDPGGQQRVLSEAPPFTLECEDLTSCSPEEREMRLARTRDTLSTEVRPLNRWPLFDLRASHLPDGRTRLHVSVDLLPLDLPSLLTLLRELFSVYREPGIELPRSPYQFRDLVLRRRSATVRPATVRYWRDRYDTFAGSPELPRAESLSPGHPPFMRREVQIEADSWTALCEQAETYGVTPTAALLAAFSEILGRWSGGTSLTLALTTFDDPGWTEGPCPLGDYTSVLPLEAENPVVGRFIDRARTLQRRMWQDLDHGDMPGPRIFRELAERRQADAAGLFPVVFTSALGHEDVTEDDDVLGALELVYSVSQTPQVLMDHQAVRHKGGVRLSWDTVDDLFPPGLLDEMFAAYTALVTDLSTNADSWSQEIHTVTARDRQWHARRLGEVPEPARQGLHEGFFEQARRDPDAPAVAMGDVLVSYGDLAAKARAVAVALQRAKIGRDDHVAVGMTRGWLQVAAVLGVHLAGAAYVPVDPGLPRSRRDELLADARIAAVCTEQDRRGCWPEDTPTIAVDSVPSGEDDQVEPVEASPADLAYIIYTSGSTGRPKGVMMTHGAALNTLEPLVERLSLGPSDRVLGVSSLSFDLSVFDVFGILAAGGTLVLPTEDTGRDPAAWLDLVVRHGVSVWNSVPMLFDLLCETAGHTLGDALASLRAVLLSGDWIPVDLVTRAREALPTTTLLGLGGATEGGIWSISYPIEQPDPGWRSVPYGQALPGQGMHVLDARGEPCPTWVQGEIFISGGSLAAGYWNDAHRTEAHFLTHPRTGVRLYRTGDQGRWLPDGNMEFLGREDLQVKVRGHRLELAEVEMALASLPGVSQAVVTFSREKQRLRGHVVLEQAATVKGEELRARLSERLPEYAVPSDVSVVDRFPLTANGKVDRKALTQHVPPTPAGHMAGPGAIMPSPRQAAVDDPVSKLPAASPEDETQSRILRLVEENLELDEAGLDDNLWDLGATSLDLVRLGNSLEASFGTRPGLEQVRELGTARGLADYYAGADRRSGTRPVDAPAPAAVRRAPAAATPATGATTGGGTAVPLPASSAGSAAAPSRGPSTRDFSSEKVTMSALGDLLSSLRPMGKSGRHAYPSAGGIYAVSVYLAVKPGGVAGLDDGIYRYEPHDHTLLRTSSDPQLDAGAHWPVNVDAFTGSSLTLLLVARVGELSERYRELARDFVLIEVGAVLQTLMDRARSAGLGVCPVGDCDVRAVRSALAEGEEVFHTILCGVPSAAGDVVEPSAPGALLTRSETSRDPDTSSLVADVAELEARAEHELPRPARVLPAQFTRRPHRLLLTGATGFLGSRVLAEILERTSAHVVCLMRRGDETEARRRVVAALGDTARGVRPEDTDRLSILPARIGDPGLGLGEEGRKLLGTLDGIYHTAAVVDWSSSYERLKRVNVDGTRELVMLAASEGIPLHHASSVAVFPMTPERAFGENDDLHEAGELVGGYAQSKWIAERVVRHATSQGLAARVYRFPLLCGDQRTGAFNGQSFFELVLRAAVQLGSFPDVTGSLNLVPVDHAAAAFVALSLADPGSGGTFHLTNPQPLDMRRLVDHLRGAGYRMQRTTYDRWTGLLREASEAVGSFAKFSPVLTTISRGDAGMPRYLSPTAEAQLAELGLDCPEISADLLNLYLRAMVTSDYLPATPSRPRGAS